MWTLQTVKPTESSCPVTHCFAFCVLRFLFFSFFVCLVSSYKWIKSMYPLLLRGKVRTWRRMPCPFLTGIYRRKMRVLPFQSPAVVPADGNINHLETFNKSDKCCFRSSSWRCCPRPTSPPWLSGCRPTTTATTPRRTGQTSSGPLLSDQEMRNTILCILFLALRTDGSGLQCMGTFSTHIK
jgi:hypothetical protein